MFFLELGIVLFIEIIISLIIYFFIIAEMESNFE